MLAGDFFVFAEEMRIWREMMLLDSALYFLSTLFGISEHTLIGFFSNSCGLRQGDLLFPLLFVIVMEALSKMIYAIVNGSLLSSFLVISRHDGAFNILHILFADATFDFLLGKSRSSLQLTLLVLMF